MEMLRGCLSSLAAVFLLQTWQCATSLRPGIEIDLSTKPGKRRAYAMMAFDLPGMPIRNLWEVMAMANVISEVSSYKLIVLTNTTHWPDGTSVLDSFAKVNAEVRPVVRVAVPLHVLREHRDMPCENEGSRKICANQFNKLQIWSLVDYDKLVWLDADGILTRSADHLFELPGTWAQQNNWDCGETHGSWWSSWWSVAKPPDDWERQSDQVCSGMLVLEPSQNTYDGLVAHLAHMPSALDGDQQVTAEYFGKSAKLLNASVASFGQCLGRTIPKNTTPIFVHKSEWHNSCFRHDAKPIDCRDNPLGVYWRHHFCKGARKAGVGGEEVDFFCGSVADKLWDRSADIL